MKKIILALFAACTFLASASVFAANKPTHYFTEDRIPHYPAGAKVLVLPLNPNTILKENEIALIEEAIFMQFEDYGLRPVRREINDKTERFNYMLLTSIRAFSLPEARAAKSKYVASVSADYDFVVMPSAYEGVGEMGSRFLYFEGAKLPIRMTSGFGEWSGQQTGIALRYEVFSNDGSWLMALQGGIAMPKYAIFSSRQFVRKDNIFAEDGDQKALQKGVKIVMRELKKQLKFK